MKKPFKAAGDWYTERSITDTIEPGTKVLVWNNTTGPMWEWEYVYTKSHGILEYPFAVKLSENGCIGKYRHLATLSTNAEVLAFYAVGCTTRQEAVTIAKLVSIEVNSLGQFRNYTDCRTYFCINTTCTPVSSKDLEYWLFTDTPAEWKTRISFSEALELLGVTPEEKKIPYWEVAYRGYIWMRVVGGTMKSRTITLDSKYSGMNLELTEYHNPESEDAIWETVEITKG